MTAQTFQIPPGTSPTRLTAPATDSQIINLSAVNTVMFGSTANVGDANGTPIPPLSSAALAIAGDLFVVMRSDSTATAAQVVVSDDSTDYDNPVALAAAVAAQLFETGIPEPIIQTLVFHGTIANGIANELTIDVSEYQSLLISPSNPVNGQSPMFAAMFDVEGGQQDAIYVPIYRSIRWIVSGSTLIVSNPNATPIGITIIGSNRTLPVRYDTRSGDDYESWFNNGNTYAVGDQLVLTTTVGGNLQGGMAYDAFVSGTIVKGEFQILTLRGILIGVVSTGSMVDRGDGTRVGQGLCACPKDLFQVVFRCTVAGTASVRLSMVPFNL